MPVLLTTAYFPPVSYMAEVLRADAIVIEAFETYPKQTCRNHCVIQGPNGRQVLSIPVSRVNGNHTMTRDVTLSAHAPWQKTHWRSIQTAYSNSPFFLYYQDEIARIFEKKYGYLLDLNMDIMQVLLKLLRVTRRLGLSSAYEKTPAEMSDLRTVSRGKSPGNPFSQPPYIQVFEARHGFMPGLSVLDVLFNLGPESVFYLENVK
jgi:hypothetical protein